MRPGWYRRTGRSRPTYSSSFPPVIDLSRRGRDKFPRRYKESYRIAIVGEIGQGGVLSVAFGARQIHDDFLGLVVRFFLDGAVGVQELVGDVSEDGGAARPDAALGDLNEETGEELADVGAG